MKLPQKFYQKYANILPPAPENPVEVDIPKNRPLPTIEPPDLEHPRHLFFNYDEDQPIVDLRLENLKKKQRQKELFEAEEQQLLKEIEHNQTVPAPLGSSPTLISPTNPQAKTTPKRFRLVDEEGETVKPPSSDTLLPPAFAHKTPTIIPPASGEEEDIILPDNPVPEIELPEDLESSPLNRVNYPRDKALIELLLQEKEANRIPRETAQILRELRRYVSNMNLPNKKVAQNQTGLLLKVCAAYCNLLE